MNVINLFIIYQSLDTTIKCLCHSTSSHLYVTLSLIFQKWLLILWATETSEIQRKLSKSKTNCSNLRNRVISHSKFPVWMDPESALTLPKVGLKHFDVILPPFWDRLHFPALVCSPWRPPPEKKSRWSARQRERERERRGELGRGEEKGVEWVGRVTVVRQPILGSDSYSTPSCTTTTTLHKQSFPFSLWHKQHSWDLTAAGDRTRTHTHAAYVHMFRRRATCMTINKHKLRCFRCPCLGMWAESPRLA